MNGSLLALWVLVGFGLSTWLMMHIWLPDPPPDPFMKYIVILIAGGIGAVIGGFLAQKVWATSDPMPGLVVVAAGALFFSGLVGLLFSSGSRAAG